MQIINKLKQTVTLTLVAAALTLSFAPSQALAAAYGECTYSNNGYNAADGCVAADNTPATTTPAASSDNSSVADKLFKTGEQRVTLLASIALVLLGATWFVVISRKSRKS